MNYYITALNNYINFKGRASRKEFWMFYLINMVIFIGLKILTHYTGQQTLIVGVYSLLVLPACVSINVRRLHDTDRSGFYMALGLIPLIGPIILFIFNIQKGTDGYNRFDMVS